LFLLKTAANGTHTKSTDGIGTIDNGGLSISRHCESKQGLI